MMVTLFSHTLSLMVKYIITWMMYRKTLKPSLASEGTLPTNDGLLGCELEAVHVCANLELSLRISQYLPTNPTPLV